jgi:small subunit ribosomal protein S16
VGHYNPAQEPVQLHLDLERVDHWVKNGAQPTRTVKTLIRRVRAQGPAEDGVVDKVVEEVSVAKPETVAAEEAQEKPEEAPEETLQAEAEEVTEEVTEEPLKAEAEEVAEEVKEEASQEEPEEVVEKAPPAEA